MEEAIAAFAEEMPVLERLINGYLASNPALAGMQVDIVRLTVKRNHPEGRRSFFRAMHNNPNDVKICKDENGVEYPYWGPNGCPTFD